MGMDAYIRAAHSKKDFESDAYWNEARLSEERGDAEEAKWTRCGNYGTRENFGIFIALFKIKFFMENMIAVNMLN